MRIIVCVKEVGYVYHPLALSKSGNEIDMEKVLYVINPYDEIAVEEAVRIKDCLEDCEILLITAGSPRSERSLRYAFALGGDRMIRIDFETLDPWTTSIALAEVIKNLPYDIIFCGKKAIDNNAGLVGSYLAELLGIPQVSGIVKMEIQVEANQAVVHRYLGRGDRQIVECGLPALFTVENGLNDPRYPSLANRLSAERELVHVIDPGSLNLSLDSDMDLLKSMNLSSPRPKPKRIFTPDSNLSASERMKLIMTGGAVEKKSRLIEGHTNDVVKKVIDILVQEDIV